MPKAILHTAVYKEQTLRQSIASWTETLGRSEFFIRGRLRRGKTMQDVVDDAINLDKYDGLGVRDEAVRKFLYAR